MSWPAKKLGEVSFMMINFIEMHAISIVWFIFAVLFLVMAWKEWRKSKRNIKSIECIQPQSVGEVNILGIDFAEMIEKFKNELNRSNAESHKIAAISYFLAGVVAFASFIISLL